MTRTLEAALWPWWLLTVTAWGCCIALSHPAKALSAALTASQRQTVHGYPGSSQRHSGGRTA